MLALDDELQDLKVVKRKEIAQKIKDEREQALFPSFPICKSSSYAVPQPGQSF